MDYIIADKIASVLSTFSCFMNPDRLSEFKNELLYLGLPGVLSDTEIAQLAGSSNLINPFEPEPVKDGKISYGLGHYGYDIRLGYKFKFDNSQFRDPKNPGAMCALEHDPEMLDKPFIIGPNDCFLGHSIETFSMPDDVMAFCTGKSTYARVGLILNTTPLEPGWSGQLTLALVNPTSTPIRIYPGEGIGQVVFFRGRRPARTYADKNGKYQNSTGVVEAKIDGQ